MSFNLLTPRCAAASAALLLATVAAAIPLDFDANGIGYYFPASELNNDAEVVIGANALVAYYNTGTGPVIEDVTFVVDAGSALPGVLPAPAVFGEKDEEVPLGAIDNTVYSYAVGKYGNVAFLFYIGDLAPGMYTLPARLGVGEKLRDINRQVLLATPERRRVPDASSTAGLLGFAIIAFTLARRKLVRS